MKEHWLSVPLRDCVDVLDHLRVPVNAKERATRSGPIPYYGATGQVGCIDGYLFDEELVLLGEDGAPFFEKSKSIAYVINGKAWVNNHAHVLRSLPNLLDNRFLKHYFDQFDFHGFVEGTTRPKLTKSSLQKIQICVPPIREQHRIVAEIEKHLSRIAVVSQALALTLSKVGSYVGRMFERAVSEAPCAEFRRVLASSLANGRSVPTADSGFPVLRLTSIRNAIRVDLSECKIGDWDVRQAEPFLVVEGDLLIVRGNGSLKLVGRAGLVQEVSSPVAYPDTLIRAKLDRSVALPAYVARAWHTRIVRNQIERVARTSAGIYKINQNDIENLRIPLPSLPVQKRLASLADAIENLATPAESAIKRAIQMSDRLRQAILKKAFEGKLLPQDPNDEPASVLLERIRAARVHTPARRAPRKPEVHV